MAWPLITFPDKLNFHLNDEDIVLHHFDKGHTDGDVIVQFKKANVVHTGDASVHYGYPIADIRDQVAAGLTLPTNKKRS
jgi:cyclase